MVTLFGRENTLIREGLSCGRKKTRAGPEAFSCEFIGEGLSGICSALVSIFSWSAKAKHIALTVELKGFSASYVDCVKLVVRLTGQFM